LGYRVIAFDNQRAPLGAAFVDDFLQVDLKDDGALIAAARAAAPDGVYCHAAELAIPVAKVAEALHLPGIGVETAICATDKRQRAEAFRQHGIETPDFRILTRDAAEAHWLDCFSDLGSKVVCKPPHLAGARGVELIESRAAVLSYRRRRGDVEAESFLMEPWIDGLQWSTESVLIDGMVVHTAIALRHYDTTLGLRPYLIEDGHSMPAEVPVAERDAIDQLVRRCAAALGLRDGVLKGDLIRRADGRIVVLEMAARTSGGRFADTVVPRATGINILYPLIQMAMGETPNRAYLRPRWTMGVSQRFFFPVPGHRIGQAPELTLLGHHPGVVDLWFNRTLLSGEAVPPVRCHGDRAGYVICTGANRAEADSLALRLARSRPFQQDDVGAPNG
jgi:biotin carboxylase